MVGYGFQRLLRPNFFYYEVYVPQDGYNIFYTRLLCQIFDVKVLYLLIKGIILANKVFAMFLDIFFVSLYQTSLCRILLYNSFF